MHTELERQRGRKSVADGAVSGGLVGAAVGSFAAFADSVGDCGNHLGTFLDYR